MRVLGFGDNFIDKFVDRRTYYPGGNAVNVAVFARELGAQAGYLGVFGNDELAAHLKTTLTELGVTIDHSVVKDGETGWAEVEVVDGDRVFRAWNEGGVTVAEPYVIDDDTLQWASDNFDVVHSGAYAGVAGELLKLSGKGPLLSYDFSEEDEFRTDAELAKLCPHLDLALFSGAEGDRAALSDALARAVVHGAGMALGTLGVEGSILWDGKRLVDQVASDPGGAVVDSMGCGDSCVAAFVVSLLSAGWSRDHRPTNEELDAALAAASSFAAKQTRTKGAFEYGRSY